MSGNSNDVYVSIPASQWSRSLANTMNDKLNTINLSPVGRCIYRVPKKFYAINKHSYVPEMVSIGPLHHDNTDLQVMENDKLQYLDTHFARMNDGGERMKQCVQAIREVEATVRECYSGLVVHDQENFIQMMLADGIFTIELFYRYNFGHTQDPVVFRWNLMSLARDMILIENQLPMEVLKRLYDITMPNQQVSKPLSELAIRFFNPLMQRKENVLAEYFETDGKHLLDLLSKTFVKRFANTPQMSNNVGVTTALLELNHEPVPCAMELQRAGVNFKKHNNAHSFLDIEFDPSVGEMQIPPIRFIPQTESLLRNFIASEQCCDGNSTVMASYAFMMCNLIQSPEDVALLRRCGVIEINIYDDTTVSSILKNLCYEVSPINFYYSKICKDVKDFYESPWHSWKAKMRRNPYNVLSLIVAIISALFGILAFASPFIEKKKSA